MNRLADRQDGAVQYREIGRPTVRPYFQYRPADLAGGAPVLVLVHGISRRAAQLAFRFREHADRHGLVIVAPLFQKVIYGQYQQVVDAKGPRADLALFDILDAVAREHCAAVDKVHLFGFSGGAQFAHRFALLHPERASSMSLAAAGWYTMPHDLRPYPEGLATHPLGERSFDLDAYLAIDRHLFVGQDDILRDASLRQTARLDRDQGLNRVERGRRFFDAMNRASAERGSVPRHSSFDILPGLGHSFGRSARRKVDLPAKVMLRLAQGLTR